MIGRLFGLLGHLPMIYDLVGAVVVGVEAIGAATRAESREKRELAVELAREQLEANGVTAPEALIGAIVDTYVRVLNIVRPSWSSEVNEAAQAAADTATLEPAAFIGSTSVSSRAKPDLEAAEAQARAELEAIERRNRGKG